MRPPVMESSIHHGHVHGECMTAFVPVCLSLHLHILTVRQEASTRMDWLLGANWLWLLVTVETERGLMDDCPPKQNRYSISPFETTERTSIGNTFPFLLGPLLLQCKLKPDSVFCVGNRKLVPCARPRIIETFLPSFESNSLIYWNTKDPRPAT